MSDTSSAKIRAASAQLSPTPSGPANHGVAGLLAPPTWSRVRRLSLIRREVREVLAPKALDLLWSRREEIIEGGREIGRLRSGSAGFFATVMVTLDLEACRGRFSEPADVATALRLAELMRDSEDLHGRLLDLVRPQLAALSQRPPTALEISLEFRVRAEGTRILIDGDAMTTPA
ncbi:MAG: hypothetical protein R3A79_05410 [Nannocystaceae bacterium]